MSTCCCRPSPCGTSRLVSGIVPVVTMFMGYPAPPLNASCGGGGGQVIVDPGGTLVTKIIDGDYLINDFNEMRGCVFYVTAPAVLTLPPVAEGMYCRIITIGNNKVFIAPDPADKIILDGKTSLVDGDRIMNVSWPGDWANLTFFNADGWSAITNGWSNAGQ